MSFCKPSSEPQRMLLRPTEAAKMMAISPRLLWSLTNAGQIPCVRIGRSVRYDPRDLEAWIMQQKSQCGANRGGNSALTSGPDFALVDANTVAQTSPA